MTKLGVAPKHTVILAQVKSRMVKTLEEPPAGPVLRSKYDKSQRSPTEEPSSIDREFALKALEQYYLTKTPADRQAAILELAPVAHKVARRLVRRLPPDVHYNDLVSFGMVGIINAIENFNPQQEATFLWYVEQRAQGTVLDALRENSLVPYSARKRQKRVSAAAKQLEERLGRSATADEIAEETGMSIRTVRAVCTIPTICYLEELGARHEASRPFEEQIAASTSRVDDLIIQRERLLVFQQMVQLFPSKISWMLRLSLSGLNDETVGRMFGVSASRISQLLRPAERLLAKIIEEYYAGGAVPSLDEVPDDKDYDEAVDYALRVSPSAAFFFNALAEGMEVETLRCVLNDETQSLEERLAQAVEEFQAGMELWEYLRLVSMQEVLWHPEIFSESEAAAVQLLHYEGWTFWEFRNVFGWDPTRVIEEVKSAFLTSTGVGVQKEPQGGPSYSKEEIIGRYAMTESEFLWFVDGGHLARDDDSYRVQQYLERYLAENALKKRESKFPIVLDENTVLNRTEMHMRYQLAEDFFSQAITPYIEADLIRQVVPDMFRITPQADQLLQQAFGTRPQNIVDSDVDRRLELVREFLANGTLNEVLLGPAEVRLLLRITRHQFEELVNQGEFVNESIEGFEPSFLISPDLYLHHCNPVLRHRFVN